MTSSLPFPYSMRHNSKFTLTKREPRISFIITQHKTSSSKPANQRNIVLNYPTEVNKQKHQKPFTSLHKKPKPPLTSHINNNNTAKTSSRPKQKKDNNLSTVTPRNNDFFRFFKQSNRRINISTNRTTNFDFSIETKQHNIHKNHTTLNNNSQLIKAICKSVNKTNKIHKKPANKHQHTSNDSNNYIPSKTKANVITKKKVNAISTYNPFHIQYTKPLFNPIKPNTTLNKNAHIMTYQMNIKQLKAGNSSNHNTNSNNNNNNNNNTRHKNGNNNNSTSIKQNTLNITNNQSRSKNVETEVLYKINRLPGSSRPNQTFDNDDDDEFVSSNRFGNNLDDDFEDDDDEEEEDSGVLAYDDVKDIIVYFDMENIDYKDKWLFYKGDYQVFNSDNKGKYMKMWFDKEEGKDGKNWYSGKDKKSMSKESKSPSTNDSNTTKNNYISVIKLNNNK